jgi:hypothetical protein
VNKKVRSSKILLGLGVGLMAIAVAGPLLMSYLPQSFQYLIIAFYVVLFAGLILFNSGIYELRKWRASPRADEVLYRELRGLRDQYRLVSFVELPGGLLLEHVLMGPSGITVVEVREQEGEFEFDGRQWRQRMSTLRRIFGSGQRALGNPFADLSKRVQALRDWLEAQDTTVPIQGVVVFSSPRARLVRVESPPFPVTTPKGLKGMMQKLRGPNLSPEVQERITKSLTELMTRPVEVKAAAPTKKTA